MSKNKKSRKDKKQNNLSKILNRDRKRYNLVPIVHKELNYSEIESSIPFLAKFYEYKEQINLSLTPNFTKFYSVKLPISDLRTNLAWCTGTVVYHKDRLKKFRELEDILQNYLLSEDYKSAINTLDNIDNICGLSTWSLGIRGSILKISDKNLDYSNFIESVMKNENYNDFFKTIFKYTVDRYNESSIHISSAESFKKQLIRTLDEDLSSFLIYKITPKDYLSDFKINYNGIFENEKRSSIIDIYKALISFVESEFLNYTESSLPAYLKNTISKLNMIAYHPIVNNAINFYGINTKEPIFKFNYSLMDLYTEGNYQELVDLTLNNEVNYEFNSFETIAKAIVRLGENPYIGLKGKIIEHILSVFLKKEDFSSSYYALLGICYAFSSMVWFQELQLFISKEFKFSGEFLSKKLDSLIALNSTADSPRKLQYFHNKNKQHFIKYLNTSCKNSITVRFFSSLSDPNICNSYDTLVPSGVDKIRLKKYKAITFFNHGHKQDEAISLLESIISNNSIIDSNDGLKFLVNAYIENGSVEKALNIFVEYVLNNRNNILIFDTEKIAFSAEKIVASSNDINVPITLSLYCKYIDDTFESALRLSFDNFLAHNNLEVPYILLENNFGYSDKKINYFLEHVCTPNNMKLSLLLNDQKEIYDCRIRICNGLIEKGVSRERLIEETKSIIKEEVFKKAVAQVDQSRIYVDVTSFKDSYSKTFREVFQQFCELRKQDYSNFSDEKTLKKLVKALSSIKDDMLEAVEIHVPGLQDTGLNEKNKIFFKLVGMLRDEFTYGDKGLNSYLSTRIRHGVLPTELRKTIQNEKLWFVIDSQSKDSIINEYWLPKLPSFEAKDKKQIFQHFSSFINSFESIISEINDSWLQIISLDPSIRRMNKDKNKALFNYSISILDTFILQSKVIGNDYDDLIDIILSLLWHKTDKNLIVIRDAIENEAFNRFKIIFDKFESNIQSLEIRSDEVQLILSSIRKAREGLNNQLKNIASWFKRSMADQMESFEITTAVEIASRSTNVHVNVINSIESKFKGRYLASFVDIFYILFENALSKSKLAREKLHIKANISLNNKDLVIMFENNNIEVNAGQKNEELNYYRNAYGKPNLMINASQHEGGTGIFKIYNIINKDIGITHTNEFGYSDSLTYKTKITLMNALEVIAYASTDS